MLRAGQRVLELVTIPFRRCGGVALATQVHPIRLEHDALTGRYSCPFLWFAGLG